MYSMKNIELVINDSILWVLSQTGISMKPSNCVAHNEDFDSNQLHWSLYFGSGEDASKFTDSYNSMLKELGCDFTGCVPSGEQGEEVNLFVNFPKVDPESSILDQLDSQKGCHEFACKELDFIKGYCTKIRMVQLKQDLDADFSYGKDFGYAWGELWGYKDHEWSSQTGYTEE